MLAKTYSNVSQSRHDILPAHYLHGVGEICVARTNTCIESMHYIQAGIPFTQTFNKLAAV